MKRFDPADDPSLAPPSPDLLLDSIVESSEDAVLSNNLNGIVTGWNRSAERIFGYPRAEVMGRPVTFLVPTERLAEETSILDRVNRGERIEHFETVRRHKDGQLVEVSATISPILNTKGEVAGASQVARDITSQNRSLRSGHLLASIVGSPEDAIVSKNLNGIITSWNATAEHMFGYTSEEIVGKSVLVLLPADRKDEEPKILARLRRGEKVEHFETVRVRKNGEQFPVSLTISPIKDAAGNIVGASKIARDITEIKRIEADREQLLASERLARSQAEHANRMKDEFLAMISHELRTPLNAIVGWTQVLKENQDAPDVLAMGIETIERNAFAQAQLIDDLLDLGRIVSGKMSLEVEPVDLAAVIADAVAAAKHSADAKDISIATVLAECPCTMTADRKRIRQVLMSLLSNAMKFTPKAGKVTVSLRREASLLELSVADNGNGIPREFLPYVFESFRQADTGTTRHHGGLGIGLSLVKQLVEMHGGDVRAESEGLGNGATFTVLLPVVALRPSFKAPVPPAPRFPGHDADDSSLRDIKILAVDDDPDSLEVIRRILTHRKARVQTATSVAEALAIVPVFQPDLLLSDIGMPQRDGYDLIRSVRRLPGCKSLPAAALTALARPEDRMQALRAGYQTHMAKPVTPDELVAVACSLVSLRARQ